MKNLLLAACAIGLVLSASPSGRAQELSWTRHKLDEAFRSEGVAAADINHDGKMDVFAGDVWYEAPEWKMHAIREVGKFVAGVGYSKSFCNWAYDINGDGWDDLILVGFPGDPFFWYENPKNAEGHWKERTIWHSACNESPCFLDLTGDGKPEIILGSQPESQMGYIEIPAPDKLDVKEWTFHAVSRPGDPAKNGTFKYYHGLGVGDFNRDGRNDVLIPHGWWEAPEDRKAVEWEFHPFALSKEEGKDPLPASNLWAEDLDLDGDSDIIMSSAHTYGVWWFENLDGTKFKYHLIDETCSQTHAMEFVDMNGDGQKDMITGKRYFAHNGHDPGEYEPVLMLWYEIHREKGGEPKFLRHEIEAGLGTGVGTQFQVTDFNGDTFPDIVLSNKKGVNVLVQSRGKK